MDRKEAAERIQEVMATIRTQHMCKDMDGECTAEDRETYIQRFEACKVAIEALQEPERKKGRWIEIIKDKRFGDEWDEIAIYKCSVCESEFVECMGTYNFCPNCGADMRGEEE